MLPFGSLLTQLPLLIIGGLYMLYLGFYAVNHSKETILSAETEIKDKSVQIKNQVTETDYFTLVSLFTEKHTVFTQTENTIQFIATYPYIGYFMSDSETIDSYRGYCLFSRPPPSLA